MSTCTIPANQPIYEALLTKAKSYPPSEVFRRRAYQTAATRLLAHDVDLFGIENRTYELDDHLDQYWGPRTAAFILNFIKENPPVADAKVACAVPANEPIYKALLEKAASYPADKPYQAKAYKKAAETVMSYEKNIYDEYSRYNVFYDYPGNIGPRIEEFIRKFIKENPSTATPDGREDEEMKHPDCFTPSNNGLYVALLKRAKERESAGNKYSAKYYRDAAAKVLSHSQSFPWLYRNKELHSEIEALGGPGVVAFIKLYLDEANYGRTLDGVTEDNKIMYAIKLFCIKNNIPYQDSLVTEYKTWRPTAPQWITEVYDYAADKYAPRSLEGVVALWLANYSVSTQAALKENAYKRGVQEYCKRNNIIYQPLMLDRLNAWRKENRGKLVNIWPASCEKGCPNIVHEWPMGPAAVINKWFQTLPKTVML
jgi:hypothetical protein